MREYQLITSNHGLVRQLIAKPMQSYGWEIRVLTDETGEVGDDEALVLNPDGEQLGRYRLTDGPKVFREIREQVTADAELADVIDDLERPPLICVRHMPTGPVLATLWLSGKEYTPSPGGQGADDAKLIQRGPNSMEELMDIIREWKTDHPGAKLESEVPLVDLVADEEPADQPLPPVAEVAAAAQPAKSPSVGARKAARAARDVGQPLQPLAPEQSRGEELRVIPIAEISHFPGGNIRERFDELDALAESIKQHGILEPLVVNQRDGRYVLIAGERRLRAAGKAGLEAVPCRVMNLGDQAALELMIVENIQRQDLTPIEEARAYERLLDIPGATQGAVADRVGKPREYVNEMLRLLELPANLSTLVANGQLSKRVALEFLRQANDLPMTVRERLAASVGDLKPTAREIRNVMAEVLAQFGVVRATPAPQRDQPAAPLPAPKETATAPEPQRAAAEPVAPVVRPPQVEAPANPPPAPTLRPAADPICTVNPAAQKAHQLAEIGRRFWETEETDPWGSYTFGGYRDVMFARECYLPLERVMKNWELRQDIGATTIPRGMGDFARINIPEQRVWIGGYNQFASRGELTLEGKRLLVKLPSGGLEAAYSGALVYYRVELRKQDQGGNKVLIQQLVIEDEGRHIVFTGSGSATIRKDLVPLLADLVNDLPGLPEGVEPDVTAITTGA